MNESMDPTSPSRSGRTGRIRRWEVGRETDRTDREERGWETDRTDREGLMWVMLKLCLGMLCDVFGMHMMLTMLNVQVYVANVM